MKKYYAFSALFIAGFYRENFSISIRNEIISSQVDCRICHISDLHYPVHGVNLDCLLQKVMKTKPDVICISGDLLDLSCQKLTPTFLDFLQQLVAIAPTLYVRGNHEVRIAALFEFEKQFEKCGLLNLSHQSYVFNNCYFNGVNELNRYADLRLNDQVYNVVLAHHPEDIHQLSKQPIDLVLSGHIHGGQVRIGSQGILGPGQGWFPKYTRDTYSINDRLKMNVSAGLGWCYRPRLNNRPEIVLVKLIKE